MNTIVLYTLTFAIGIFGLSMAIRSLINGIKAERDFKKILKDHSSEISGIINNRIQIYPSKSLNGKLTYEPHYELFEAIKELVENLPVEEQREILEPLEQPSIDGRINYLKRLLVQTNLYPTV